MICVHYEGFSSCNFVSFVDRPNYNLAKVFFVVLRGPSWMKKVFPPAFVDRPNYNLAKVFFVALRGPSWIKKMLSPALRGQTKL